MLYTHVRRSHLTYSLKFCDKRISFSDIHIYRMHIWQVNRVINKFVLALSNQRQLGACINTYARLSDIV